MSEKEQKKVYLVAFQTGMNGRPEAVLRSYPVLEETENTVTVALPDGRYTYSKGSGDYSESEEEAWRDALKIASEHLESDERKVSETRSLKHLCETGLYEVQRKGMKSLVLTPEILKEFETLRHAAWGALNKEQFTKDNVRKLAQLLTEIDRFVRYGDPEKCIAGFWHGPGHQSRDGCRLQVGHEGRHETYSSSHRSVVRWEGLYSASGYFDELPEDPEDEE